MRDVINAIVAESRKELGIGLFNETPIVGLARFIEFLENSMKINPGAVLLLVSAVLIVDNSPGVFSIQAQGLSGNSGNKDSDSKSDSSQSKDKGSEKNGQNWHQASPLGRKGYRTWSEFQQ